jgi:hypothetical protein
MRLRPPAWTRSEGLPPYAGELVYALGTSTEIRRITDQVVCKGKVVPVELAEAGRIVYAAPSLISHVGRVFAGGACVKHVYLAIPVLGRYTMNVSGRPDPTQ